MSERREPTMAARFAESWPCRTPPAIGVPDRLVALLYVLLRDRVAPGDLEQICLEIRGNLIRTSFTNPHLEAYARSLGTYLLEGHTVTLERAAPRRLPPRWLRGRLSWLQPLLTPGRQRR